VTMFVFAPNGLEVSATLPDTGAWVLSSHTVDASGHAVDRIPSNSSLSSTSGPCGPPEQPPASGGPGEDVAPCLAEVKRLGYRQQVTYQPSSRYWTFQAYETAIFVGLALLLSGFCFWRLRDRVA
jgi:hypothetical protein